MGVVVVDGRGGLLEAHVVRSSLRFGLDRLHAMAGVLAELFEGMAVRHPRMTEVVVEAGIFRAVPAVIAILGEVRGLVYAAAWGAGLSVRTMAPQTWKVNLTRDERLMVKNGRYTDYWNRRLGTAFVAPDQVDAYQIARRYVVGKGRGT
jgi:hypothetical protein